MYATIFVTALAFIFRLMYLLDKIESGNYQATREYIVEYWLVPTTIVASSMCLIWMAAKFYKYMLMRTVL